jgi:esterase/lipase superfamily enzyme
MGAYHAVHFAFQRADLVPLAIGLSGNYDVNSWRSWGERGDATYFANPTDYVPNLHGDHLDWLRSRLSLLLVVGQGAWETHPTGSLPSTVTFAGLVQDKGIRCELDLWGFDVSHDWEWWQRQLAHHLPRFC